MANFNSTQYAKVLADPRQALRTQDMGGRVRVMRADFANVDAAENDTLTLGKLPAGAVVVGIGIKHTDLGTSITLDLGHADDVDAYVDGLDVAAAAGNVFLHPETFTPLAAETEIFATLLGGNPDAGSLNFTVLYVVD